MNRTTWFGIFAVSGAILIIAAWLIPAHFRAVDAAVLERTPPAGTSVIDAGLDLVAREKIGPAYLLLQAAQQEELRGRQELGMAAGNFAMKHSELLVWGGAFPILENVFQNSPQLRHSGPQPAYEFLLRQGRREVALQFLQNSRQPGVREILKTRGLPNTVHFPRVNSASGQALDAAILMTAVLMQGDFLAPALRESIERLAVTANSGVGSAPLEEAYLDLVALGRRLNWVELTTFIASVESLDDLRTLAQAARQAGDRLPVLFAVVHLSGEPARAAAYLKRFGETGLPDLALSLRGGTGALKHVLERQQPVYRHHWRGNVVAYDPFGAFFYAVVDSCRSTPTLAVIVKYLLFLAGGLLVVHGGHYWGRAPSPIEQALEIKRIAWIRQGCFALLLLTLVIGIGEPYLAQETQKMEPPPRVQFSLSGNAMFAQLIDTLDPMLNQITILSLVLFLVVQAIIYAVCLIKLAEIRRQNVSNEIKIKLLDNEENMFDAGLYVGLGGTVAALVLLALGVIKPSLMAAYASTLFGIIFVGVLKICHLRPFRRKLILESQITPS
jgi:uncharacterized membrane protein